MLSTPARMGQVNHRYPLGGTQMAVPVCDQNRPLRVNCVSLPPLIKGNFFHNNVCPVPMRGLKLR